MPSSTVEDYLKKLCVLQQERRGGLVVMGTLASAVGVTAGTATTMVKALAEAGLVRYAPRGGCALTRRGKQLALAVLRRHRIIELFLVQALGLDWSEVHDEAEHLEHAVSDKVLEKMDALLGRPEVDPHGDPIPARRGTPRGKRAPRRTLAQCAVDQPQRVARVLDQEPAFLRFVEKSGLSPGAAVTVVARDPAADSVTLKAGPRHAPVTLGPGAAAKILVSPA